MEDKMDSDRSYSGDSSSTSESSSGSSDGDEDSMEPVRILGQTLELPQELCEDYSIFKEFFSMKTWESLDDKHKQELRQYLPKFTENAEEETEKTIQMLFNYETFHFTSPLSDFYNNLKQGNYRPDIAKMRKFLKKAKSKQQKHKVKSYYAKLLPEVLISRERLLAAAKSAPPGPAPSVPLLPPKPSSKNNYKPVYLRAKQRYFEELAAIRSEVGGDETEDDNYPEGPPEPPSRKRKNAMGPSGDSGISGTLGGSDQTTLTSLQCLKNVLQAHRFRRQYRENHPELNTTGITLEDIKQRVAIVNGAKKLMFGGPKASAQKIKRGPKKESMSKSVKLGEGKASKKIKEEVESVETKPVLPNIKIKQEIEESDSESSSFVDPVASPKPIKRLSEHIEIKQEIDKYPNISNTSYDSKLESMIKQEPPDPYMKNHQPVPIKLEDLDGIDMMALPIEIADDACEVIHVETSSDMLDDATVEIDESLTETTHASFLSLVRALFPARDAHRASKQQLHARCAAVMTSPIAPLNTWYNLSDHWCAELDSALDFLAGERGTHPDDFVPYLQYIPETQMYQWIGAGRDCDAILGRLCERWLRSASPTFPFREPPPPKYPTTWTVRPPTAADICEFRAQERRRFQIAARPFTYTQHGYRAVVGPCGRAWATAGGGAAGGALLRSDRPRHATFAALLRDALARLPNGEGTRHDVLTLLKMSQYVAPCSDQALLGAVSATLERFHSAKRDPVVRYEQRTAVWTYLHRNRTEEDWVKHVSGRGRAAKAAAAAAAAAAAFAPPALPPPAAPSPDALPGLPPPAPVSAPSPLPLEPEVCVEEAVEASDSDVDVDDSGAPPSVPQLSSAQLLMQATQTQPKPVPPPSKPKPKLVPTPPQKKSYTPKQNNQKLTKQAVLMTQSVKQANLLAQSVKQASLAAQQKANMVQAVKNSVSKQAILVQPPKAVPTTSQIKQSVPPKTPKTVPPKQVIVKPPLQSPKLLAAPRPAVSPQAPLPPSPQPQPAPSPKQPAQSPKPPPPSPKQPQPVKQPAPSPKQTTPIIKPVAATSISKVDVKSTPVPIITQTNISIVKSMPSIVATPNKSPLIKQRTTLKTETIVTPVVTTTAVMPQVSTHTIIQPVPVVNPPILQTQPKVIPGTRSLLIRPPNIQTTVTPSFAAAVAQTPTNSRRGVVRVLSPANPSSGKSLISPRALLQDNPNIKKRNCITTSVTTIAQGAPNMTTVVSSAPTIVTTAASTPTRTVQLAGGRTVQLAANQTVQLPGGQAVQLSSGHTLQLSGLQLSTHSVRLPSGQTVQLATPMQALKASTAVKNSNPRIVQTSAGKAQSVQIPVSTVQLTGQTVQIAGQTVQLAGQSVQLTGHTVKLPSGQSVQVASQSVQLPGGQTVQLAGGNVQTVQIAGSNVQLTGQSVQLPAGSQTVQLTGQTVQLASGQTVQLPSGQTVQLPSGQTLQLPGGQTVQLSSGQTLQLASGQTVQLANQTTKVMPQVVRSQTQGDKSAGGQPIVAKLLTNAQGQMVSLEGMVGAGRTIVSGIRPRPAVRVLSPATRLTRPLLLTSAKPLHNIILQQGDGSTVRVTSSGGASTSQTIVISNIGGQTVTTPTTATPVLKLQQVNPIQQVKLAQGIKIQQTSSAGTAVTPSGVRSVVMDGQQLKLVGGRHVLARILRPALPPSQ